MQDEKTSLSLAHLVREPHGIATVVFEVISTLAMLPFIYIEVCTIREYGWWGWLDFWYALYCPYLFPDLSLNICRVCCNYCTVPTSVQDAPWLLALYAEVADETG